MALADAVDCSDPVLLVILGLLCKIDFINVHEWK